MDKRIFAVIVLLLAALSCATSRTTVLAPQKAEIDKTKPIYVMQAKDGAYGGTVYAGSGLNVSKSVLRTLRQLQPLAQLVEKTDEADAIKAAKEKGATYLIIPDLSHWEPRATQWSGYRTKIEVELRILSLEPVEVISSRSYYGTNNSITFFNTKPEDLLDHDFDEFVLKFLGMRPL